jgi:hypothetical protein
MTPRTPPPGPEGLRLCADLFRRQSAFQARLADVLAGRIGHIAGLRALEAFAASPEGGPDKPYVLSFACLRFGYSLSVFTQLAGQVPEDETVVRYISSLWERADLPPLRRRDSAEFQARLSGLGPESILALDVEGRILLIAFAVGEALKLRGASQLGREAARDGWTAVTAASGRVVEVGAIVASSAVAATLDWAEAPLPLAFRRGRVWQRRAARVPVGR